MMKFSIGAFLAIVLAGTTAFAEWYKLEGVKRVDSNLYKARNPAIYIETRFCYHYTYGEDALYNDRTDKILWEDSTSCDVKRLFK